MARRLRSIGIALAWVCTVCGAQAAPCDAPARLNDGWQVEADPAAAGFDAGQLCTVLRNVADADINFHSLLVVRHGRLVAEVYRAGKDERVKDLFRTTRTFDASTLHDIRSISKSVTSLLWGIAQGQGKTPPLDTPVLSLFPGLADLNRDGREAITLSQMLSMSSGLAWNEWRATSLFNNDEFGLFWHTSQAHYVFDRPMAAAAGTQFNYNGGNTAVLAQLLAERVGMPVPEYARKQLLEPLGITDWEWVDDYRGRPLAFAGVRLRPETWRASASLCCSMANGTGGNSCPPSGLPNQRARTSTPAWACSTAISGGSARWRLAARNTRGSAASATVASACGSCPG